MIDNVLYSTFQTLIFASPLAHRAIISSRVSRGTTYTG